MVIWLIKILIFAFENIFLDNLEVKNKLRKFIKHISWNIILSISLISKLCIYLFKGYFGALRQEKVHTNIYATLLCPGPVFSNFLKESFTAHPGEVIKLYYK